VIAAERITEPIAHHGEGPVWNHAEGVLYWVDMLAGDVLQRWADGSVARHHVGTVAAALRPRRGGGMVIATERGFVLAEADWSRLRMLPDVFSDPAIRMNDGGCDLQGRFYCGTMAYEGTEGAGTLFRLDPDGSTHTVLNGVTISNGLAWTADGLLAYYVDTATQRIDVFDFDPDTAEFAHRRPVVTVDFELGSPDGLTLDDEGGIWVALWDGAAVHRYTPQGVLDAVIELPTSRVTACTFGGPGLDELFITTSALGLDGREDTAGALFRAAPGVRGTPSACFAG